MVPLDQLIRPDDDKNQPRAHGGRERKGKRGRKLRSAKLVAKTEESGVMLAKTCKYHDKG